MQVTARAMIHHHVNVVLVLDNIVDSHDVYMVELLHRENLLPQQLPAGMRAAHPTFVNCLERPDLPRLEATHAANHREGSAAELIFDGEQVHEAGAVDGEAHRGHVVVAEDEPPRHHVGKER